MTDTLPEASTLPPAPVAPAAAPDQAATDLATAPSAVATAAEDAPAAKTGKRAERPDVQPVLEKLFELYPHLFGATFLPLKLGIFQELVAAHPQELPKEGLKAALGVHTRSARYLQCVAAGNPRHDLAGQPVEPVAPRAYLLCSAGAVSPPPKPLARGLGGPSFACRR